MPGAETETGAQGLIMLEEQLYALLDLLLSNPVFALLLAVIVVALCYFRPKAMFRLALFSLFIVLVFYFIAQLAGMVSTGSQQKDRMIYKSRDVIGE
jgi:4-hydroxybenzoate polyprenyltransferase